MFEIDSLVSALSEIDLGSCNHISNTYCSSSEQQELQYSVIQKFDLTGRGSPTNVVMQIFSVLSKVSRENNQAESENAYFQKVYMCSCAILILKFYFLRHQICCVCSQQID